MRLIPLENSMTMGLFNRNKKEVAIVQNALEVNDIDSSSLVKPFEFNFFKRRGREDFASFFLHTVTDKIYKGLHNVTWTTTEPDWLASDICSFIDRNAPTLIWHWWRNGYVCVFFDEKTKNLRLPRPNELKFDSDRRVINKNCVVAYSEPYVIERRTHLGIAAPMLKNVNSLMNNAGYITENSGLYGILSGKSIPMSPAAKQELQEKFKKEYGLEEDKYNFVLSNAEVSYTPITIPVKDLEIYEKLKDDIAWICNFFSVNPQYIFGDSTFDNQAEATKEFYKSCIQPLAEVLLSVGRMLYVKLSKALTPSTVLTYNFENVPEMNTNLSDACTERLAYLNYLLALRDAGQDVEDLIMSLARDAKTLKNV